jgi:hypothetical protein
MDRQTLQDISHQLQLIFAGIFLFQAFAVYRVSRLELSIPYTRIVPMLEAASEHYLFWACYWKAHAGHEVRIVVHLVWLAVPVFLSLLTVVFADKAFFFSSTPMTSIAEVEWFWNSA